MNIINETRKLDREYNEKLFIILNKKKQSQRIMMEQLEEKNPARKCMRCFYYDTEVCPKCDDNYSGFKPKQDKPNIKIKKFKGLDELGSYFNFKVIKQDKPVEPNLVTVHCKLCGITHTHIKESPIKDTNKTSLEVPLKIKDRPGYIVGLKPLDDTYLIVDKINSILDYLTLISLDKKV